jgi:hypothetical protein
MSHLISCIILSLILFPFFSYYSLLIFIFGFFIDLDHYIYDVIKTKNFSLINSYKKHNNENIISKDQLHILHTIEFIIFFIIITIFSNNVYLLLISLGLLLHLILDFSYWIHKLENKTKINQSRAFSLIFWIKRNLLD